MKKLLCAILILIVAFIPFSSYADEYEEEIDVEVIFDETIHDVPNVVFISGYPYVRLRQTDRPLEYYINELTSNNLFITDFTELRPSGNVSPEYKYRYPRFLGITVQKR